jgi:hypothetical protein
MVTKQEVRDYYANNRKDSNKGMCPRIVEESIDHLGTDAEGNLISLASYIDESDCTPILSLDEVKETVRKNIRQYVVDLIKIAEI